MGASAQFGSRNIAETDKIKSQTQISYSTPDTLWGLSPFLLTLWSHSITREPPNVGCLVIRLDD